MIGYIFVLSIICFFILFFRKREYAIGFIILSFAFNYPFSNLSFFSQGFSFSVLLIYLFSLLKFFTRRTFADVVDAPRSVDKGVIRTKRIIIILVLYGLVLGLLRIGCGEAFSDESGDSEVKQLLETCLGYFSIPLLINILLPFLKDLDFIEWLQKIFVFAVCVQFIGYVISASNPLGSELFYFGQSDSEKLGIDIIRYKSFLLDYELSIDYFFIVMIIAYTLWLRRKKYVYLLLIILSGILSLTTGTRSYLLIIGCLILLNIFLRRGAIMTKIILVVCLLCGCLIFIPIVNGLSKLDFPIFVRLQEIIVGINNKENLSRITNRDFSVATDDILKEGGLWGVGAFYLNKYHNNEMISHNLILALFCKFGLFGVLVFLRQMLIYLKRIWRFVSSSRSGISNKTGLVYLASILCLLLQELKISCLRYPNILLIYTLFFLMMHSFFSNGRIWLVEGKKAGGGIEG